ncbi:hypothetical protein CHS0354_035832 [Potamilus streckersoni]|uniref:Major facilitator superfamily (MFS) profile domain-containing protein n=1 Tax=Potamilus streckersoni TaxID=2493646 RepID=A0AAE0SX76_9BIVA|nr:hypothetical protein CHS0354_035832 [Potamilus streckersoni]
MEVDREDCPLLHKKHNVDEEIDVVNVTENSKKRDFTGNLALSIFACVLGSSFQFGYNTGVVNSPAKVIKSFYNETYINRTGSAMSSSTLTVLWAITVSIFAVGGMIGGFSAGYWANRFGRRGALLRNNVLAVIGALVLFSSKYAKSYEMLIVGRFIIGINAGINTGIAPLYLSEIAPLSLRGFCGTLNQLAICSGVMTSQILGLSYVLGTDDLWQFAVGFSVIPVIFQLCTLSCCPESPRYLFLTKDEVDDAEIALQWLRKSIDVSDEIDEMASEKLAQSKSKKFSFGDLLKSPSLKAPLIISLVMQLSSQFSGINARDIEWLKYICIIAVIVYIMFFASGPGSIPWFFVAELFAQGPRTAAVSVAVLVNWFSNFIIGLVFPILQETYAQYSFIPFVVLLAVFWFYTLLRVPETKGKTIEEITALFQKKAINN